jgi:WWE domain
MASWKERPNACKDEREMFLTKLLVGNEININRDESHSKEAECRALTVPPVNPVTGLKYNTVTGSTGGSQVWIVYENGRAYPDYLVRYYRGKRDNRRTPFDTEARAKKYRKEAKEEPSLNHFMKKKEQSVDLEIGNLHPNVMWEFEDDGDWKPFADNHQAELERVFQDRLASPSSGPTKIRISTSTWEYEIDVADMIQENISHQSRKKRAIRRVSGENDCYD